MIVDLFNCGEEIELKQKSVRDLSSKIKDAKSNDKSVEKVLKSKKITLSERLAVINEHVEKVLGRYRSNVLVIKTKEDFENYITEAINSGIIAIDTETNNSTDTALLNIMGLCLYYPGGKQAYIPVNHRNPNTRERLSWQLTETDIKEQLERVNDSNILQEYHNGTFDFEVIKQTCGVEVKVGWDTSIAAILMDESKFKDKTLKLKDIYTRYIDRTQEKYDIEGLFNGVCYADVDPDVFALYAATDSYETDAVRVWEWETFYNLEENSSVKQLLTELELKLIPVVADMELRGVSIDKKLGERLQEKYRGELSTYDDRIMDILNQISPIITAWRLTPIANQKTRQYASKKSKMTKEKLEATYTLIDESGKRYKVAKSLSEQLPTEVNIDSPTQLAILLYDILGCKGINERATGEDELKGLMDSLTIKEQKTEKEDFALKLCEQILERRGLAKLVSTYIDVIPDLASHWPDGRIRYRLHSLGTDTGRFSSGGRFKFLDENENPTELSSINSQNIPSHGSASEIRMLFQATIDTHTVECNDNQYIIPVGDEVETIDGWKNVKELTVGDILIGDNNKETITQISLTNKEYVITVKEEDFIGIDT